MRVVKTNGAIQNFKTWTWIYTHSFVFSGDCHLDEALFLVAGLRYIRELQNTVEDLPFERTELFSQKIDDAMCTLKDSWAVLRSLEVYILVMKRKHMLSTALTTLRMFLNRRSKHPRCHPSASSIAGLSHWLQNNHFYITVEGSI